MAGGRQKADPKKALGLKKTPKRMAMHALLKEIGEIPGLTRFGRVARIEGLAVEVTGAQGAVSLGGQVRLTLSNKKRIPCEVVGFPRWPGPGHAAGPAGRDHSRRPCRFR